jgi:two-component system, OmpR family, response regulator
MYTKRILVIDDEPSVTQNLKLNLESSGGYDVFAENDAINALTAARIFRPDLILLDVIMPGMDGGEVAARLRKDPLLRNTPVIFLTGIISNEETDGHEMISGGETFLAKPVDIDELKKTLEDHMPRCICP